MRKGVAVFLGGGLGSLARAVLIQVLSPWGSLVPVLLINVAGACALGVVFVLVDDAGFLGTQTRLFMAIGVLGGFTTFSTFAWGVDVTIAQANSVLAGAYVIGTVGGGIAAVALGIRTGHTLINVMGRRDRRVLLRNQPHGHGPESVAHDMALIETEDREETA